VVGVQDEEALERLREHWVDLIRLGEVAEVELEEVVDEVQRVVRVQEGLADALLVRVGGDDRDLREEADGRLLDHLGVVDVERVLVVGRERVDRAGEHRHGVSVRRQCREEALEILVQEGVVADAIREVLVLGLGGELTVEEQVGDFEEARLGGELLDRIAAVTQDAVGTIDVRDGGLGRRRVDEALVERRVPRLLHERRDVDRVSAFGGAQDWELRGPVADPEGGRVRLVLVGLSLLVLFSHRSSSSEWGMLPGEHAERAVFS
jgi:hypothetical protein